MRERAWNGVGNTVSQRGIFIMKKISETDKKNKSRNRREKVRIEVRPVYVGERPMTEAIGNAVADKIKSSMDKAG